MNKKESSINRFLGTWGKLYRITVFILAPLLLLIFIVLNWSSFYEDFFVDPKYCLGSKEKFEFSYEASVDYEPISEIFLDSITYLSTGNDIEGEVIFTCATESKSHPNFKINNVKVGDTIVKIMNTNNFSIIKNKVEYIFIIDSKYDTVSPRYR